MGPSVSVSVALCMDTRLGSWPYLGKWSQEPEGALDVDGVTFCGSPAALRRLAREAVIVADDAEVLGLGVEAADLDRDRLRLASALRRVAWEELEAAERAEWLNVGGELLPVAMRHMASEALGTAEEIEQLARGGESEVVS